MEDDKPNDVNDLVCEVQDGSEHKRDVESTMAFALTPSTWDDNRGPSVAGDMCNKGAVGQNKGTPDNWEQFEDAMTTEACARAITQTEAILREWNARSECTLRELNEPARARTEVILKALRTEVTKIRKGTIGIEIRSQPPLVLMDTDAWSTTDSSSSLVRALEDGNLPQPTPSGEADGGDQRGRQKVLNDDRHRMQVRPNRGLTEPPQQGEPEHLFHSLPTNYSANMPAEM
ncbi:hypothetical protein Hamer_G016354 [Homarus americanus]|uniref:Uncharacterized protein n=1 Tax=Homarus americanus TaxID=6706 RepID=A0A8J5MRZ8_HOMAM|nr:hypothetical protein Hamer_G016354 [Homarus americanus]